MIFFYQPNILEEKKIMSFTYKCFKCQKDFNSVLELHTVHTYDTCYYCPICYNFRHIIINCINCKEPSILSPNDLKKFEKNGYRCPSCFFL